jgi:hypothetical protein
MVLSLNGVKAILQRAVPGAELAVGRSLVGLEGCLRERKEVQELEETGLFWGCVGGDDHGRGGRFSGFGGGCGR